LHIVKLFQELGSISSGNSERNDDIRSISTHKLSSFEPRTVPMTRHAVLVEKKCPVFYLSINRHLGACRILSYVPSPFRAGKWHSLLLSWKCAKRISI